GVDVADHPDRLCQAHNDRVLDFLRSSKIDTVILAARWTAYVDPTRYGDDDGSNIVLADSQSDSRSPDQNLSVFQRTLPKTIKTLREMGYRVAVVGPVPEIGFNVPVELANRRLHGRSEDIGPTTAEFQSRNKTVLTFFQEQGTSADFLY